MIPMIVITIVSSMSEKPRPPRSDTKPPPELTCRRAARGRASARDCWLERAETTVPTASLGHSSNPCAMGLVAILQRDLRRSGVVPAHHGSWCPGLVSAVLRVRLHHIGSRVVNLGRAGSCWHCGAEILAGFSQRLPNSNPRHSFRKDGVPRARPGGKCRLQLRSTCSMQAYP